MPLLPEMLLKTRGSFCMSNESCAGHTNHLELPVGIQYTSSNCFRRFPLSLLIYVQGSARHCFLFEHHLSLVFGSFFFSLPILYFVLLAPVSFPQWQLWCGGPMHPDTGDTAGSLCTLALVTPPGSMHPSTSDNEGGPCTLALVTPWRAHAP